MSLELAMVRFVGAGLSLWATGMGLRVPQGHVSNNLPFIDKLSREAPEDTPDVLANITARIWSDLGQTEISMTDVKHHIQALPELLESCRPDAKLFSAAIGQAEFVPCENHDFTHLSRHISSQFSEAFRESDVYERHELKPPLTFFLITWLFQSLLANNNRISNLRPALEKILQDLPVDSENVDDKDEELTSVAETKAETAALEEEERDKTKAVTAIIDKVETNTGFDRQLLQRLAAHYDKENLTFPSYSEFERDARSYDHLVSQLNAIGQEDYIEEYLRLSFVEAAQTLLQGGFIDAAQVLQQAELIAAEHLPRIGLSGEPIALEESYPLLTVKTLRAKYFEVMHHWHDAATGYEKACRLLPVGARYERWSLLMKCASALAHQGENESSIEVLTRASQVYVEAGDLVSEQENPKEWAETQLDIGRVLLMIGKRENRPNRYLAASSHCKSASDAFLRKGALHDWARSELMLGKSLKGQGDIQADVAILREAVSCFGNALKVFSKDEDLELWAQAQCGLGMCLQRICQETEKLDDMPEALNALEHVIKVSDDIDGNLAIEADAAMARGQILVASETQDKVLLENAVGMLKLAKVKMAGTSSSFELAELERSLGVAMWGLGKVRGNNATDLVEAMSAFQSALAHYQSSEDKANAELVREKITELQTAIGG